MSTLSKARGEAQGFKMYSPELKSSFVKSQEAAAAKAKADAEAAKKE
tara:strand:- start:246 stop:386 length:141 start_codon:yes stop_codon:yes gene_type:complete